jgi:hypothetical protein
MTIIKVVFIEIIVLEDSYQSDRCILFVSIVIV